MKNLLTFMAFFVGMLGMSQAGALVVAYDGNDCSGVFGQGFESCEVNGSPIIIKLGAGNDFGENEINSLFPTIAGDEFTFDYDDGTTSSGSWQYIMGVGDPFLTAFVAKGGSEGLYLFTDLLASVNGTYSGIWYTPSGGLSHLSFYDTGVAVIPLPAALPLMVTGLSSLGLLGWRRKRKSALVAA